MAEELCEKRSYYESLRKSRPEGASSKEPIDCQGEERISGLVKSRFSGCDSPGFPLGRTDPHPEIRRLVGTGRHDLAVWLLRESSSQLESLTWQPADRKQVSPTRLAASWA